MFLIAFILLVLCGLYTKKKSNWFQWIVILFICLMTYMAHGKPDFDQYQTVYNYIGNHNFYLDTGIGWYYLCLVGNKLHLSYKIFEIVIIFIALILLKSTISRYLNVKNQDMVWTLFLIFPALLDCTQVRFFLAEAIVISALPFLIEKSKKGILVFILATLLAYTIHSSTIFYLLFLLVIVFDRIKQLTVWVIIFMSGLVMLGKEQLINQVASLTNFSRITRYFLSTDGVGIYGIIAYIFVLTFMYVLAQKCLRMYTAHRNDEEKENKKLELFYEFLSQATLLIFIILPLTFFDTNFFRLQRPFWLLTYIALAGLRECGVRTLSVKNMKAMSIRSLGFGIALLGFVFFIAYFTFNIIQAFLL